jgi:hypothetical protein
VLVDFMEVLARRYPTQRVFVVWDNLNVRQGHGSDLGWRRQGESVKFDRSAPSSEKILKNNGAALVFATER